MRGRRAALGAVAAASAILALHQALFVSYTVDDAFINFRYAQSVSRGADFALDAGTPVMGFVDTLWILLLAACDRLGLDLVAASKALGALCAYGALAACARLSRRIGGAGEEGFPLAPLLCAAAGPFALWSVSGMETGLYSLVLSLAFLALVRPWEAPADGLKAGLLFALATLVRPEALGLGAAAFLARTLAGGIAARRSRLLFVAGLAVPVLAYLGWIRATFPDPLPNVFYAKGTPADPRLWKIGAGYVHSFLLQYGGFLLLGLAPILGLLRPDGNRAGAFAVAAALAVGVAYSASVGGDWMEGHRFFAPLLPLWFPLVERGLRAVAEAFRGAGRPLSSSLTAAFAAALLAILGLPTRRLPLPPETGHAHRSVIEWLREHARPGASVALWDVGAIPYLTGLPAIDFAGLTDRDLTRTFGMRPFSPIPYERAQGEAVVRHVLERRPAYILLKMDGDRPVATELADLFFEAPEFGRLYRRVGAGVVTSRYGVFERTTEG